MTDRHAADATRVEGKVRVRTFDDADLREAARDRGLDYDDMSKAEKLSLVEAATEAGDLAPRLDETTENQTLQQFHERLVDLFDPGTAQTSVPNVSHMALGTDGTAEDHTQSGLLAEHNRYPLTRTENEGDDLYTSLFLDTAEGNAASGDFKEAMVTSDGTNPTDGNDINFNRAVIPDLTKNDLTTATIDITLQFRP